jgi:hypothetical protein
VKQINGTKKKQNKGKSFQKLRKFKNKAIEEQDTGGT